VKVARYCKRLADDAGANELAVLVKELAVCLVLEEHLSDTCDDEWVHKAKDNGSD
jgi:hypothetical protein